MMCPLGSADKPVCLREPASAKPEQTCNLMSTASPIFAAPDERREAYLREHFAAAKANDYGCDFDPEQIREFHFDCINEKAAPGTHCKRLLKLLNASKHLAKPNYTNDPTATANLPYVTTLQYRSSEDGSYFMRLDERTAIAFVVDGHGKDANNNIVQNILPYLLVEALQPVLLLLSRGPAPGVAHEVFADAIRLEIERLCADIDDKIYKIDRALFRLADMPTFVDESNLISDTVYGHRGSCAGAVVAGCLIAEGRAAFFNVGDSQAILVRPGPPAEGEEAPTPVAAWVSEVHNKSNPREVERAMRAGGLDESLAVTRSFGDNRSKRGKYICDAPNGVTCTPAVHVVNLQPGESIVLCTDGFTDQFAGERKDDVDYGRLLFAAFADDPLRDIFMQLFYERELGKNLGNILWTYGRDNGARPIPSVDDMSLIVIRDPFHM